MNFSVTVCANKTTLFGLFCGGFLTNVAGYLVYAEKFAAMSPCGCFCLGVWMMEVKRVQALSVAAQNAFASMGYF